MKNLAKYEFDSELVTLYLVQLQPPIILPVQIKTACARIYTTA